MLSRGGRWLDLGGAPTHGRADYGIALLPLAGVAIGIALAAVEATVHHAGTILTFAIVSTIVFDLVGLIVTVYGAWRVAAMAKSEGTAG